MGCQAETDRQIDVVCSLFLMTIFLIIVIITHESDTVLLFILFFLIFLRLLSFVFSVIAYWTRAVQAPEVPGELNLFGSVSLHSALTLTTHFVASRCC